MPEEMENLALIALFMSAAAVTCYIAVPQRRRRRFKVRPMNRRKQFSIYEKLVKYAKQHDRDQFFKYTRMSPEMFDYLLGLLLPSLQRTASRNPVPPGQRLAITLHYLSEGTSMQEVAWNNYIGITTAHKIIIETCEAIWDFLSPIVLPQPGVDELKRITEENYCRWNMPNCIGSIDRKHVQIQAPKFSGSDFFSYKKSFSMVILAACDAYYKFTFVDIGGAGSNHDSTIFKNSCFGRALFDGSLPIPINRQLPKSHLVLPHFFVADQAFPLHLNITRLFPGSYLSEEQNIFNLRLSRVRRTIENTFGILAQRWRRLRSPIIASVTNCEHIIKACVALHNFIQKGEEDMPLNEKRYCPTGFTDWEDEDGVMHDGQWRALGNQQLRSVGRLSSNNASKAVKEMRDHLAAYLISPAGAVPYQWNKVNQGGVPDDFAHNFV